MHSTAHRDPDTITDCVITARGHLDRVNDHRHDRAEDVVDILKRLRTCLDRIEEEFRRLP